jgi:xylan 1,4-beta-xylosidase
MYFTQYPTDGNCPGGKTGGALWGPDCHTRLVKAAKATLPPNTSFFLSEYNVGCCLGYSAAANTHDTSAAAAFIFRQVGELDGVVDVLSWWTFSDVFEEAGIPTAGE